MGFRSSGFRQQHNNNNTQPQKWPKSEKNKNLAKVAPGLSRIGPSGNWPKENIAVPSFPCFAAGSCTFATALSSDQFYLGRCSCDHCCRGPSCTQLCIAIGPLLPALFRQLASRFLNFMAFFIIKVYNKRVSRSCSTAMNCCPRAASSFFVGSSHISVTRSAVLPSFFITASNFSVSLFDRSRIPSCLFIVVISSKYLLEYVFWVLHPSPSSLFFSSIDGCIWLPKPAPTPAPPALSHANAPLLLSCSAARPPPTRIPLFSNIPSCFGAGDPMVCARHPALSPRVSLFLFIRAGVASCQPSVEQSGPFYFAEDVTSLDPYSSHQRQVVPSHHRRLLGIRHSTPPHAGTRPSMSSTNRSHSSP